MQNLCRWEAGNYDRRIFILPYICFQSHLAVQLFQFLCGLMMGLIFLCGRPTQRHRKVNVSDITGSKGHAHNSHRTTMLCPCAQHKRRFLF